ncbi:MBG domain-containing protein [Nocardioides sp.]|uniref:MBG domain-containing protein n=1 Tax=Nocardioides sp. TaxID=35761 RepID=UPI00351544F4
MPSLVAAGLLGLTSAIAVFGPVQPASAETTGAETTSAPTVPTFGVSVIVNAAGGAGTTPTDPAAGPAAAAKLAGDINDVAVGAGGVVYVANGKRIVRLDPQTDGSYDLVRLVGTGVGASGEGPTTGADAATSAFGAITQVAVAPDGRLYFIGTATDSVNSLSLFKVFRLETNGTVTQFLSTTGPLTDLAVSPDGSLYVAARLSLMRFDAPVTAGDTPTELAAKNAPSIVTATPQPLASVSLAVSGIAVEDADTYYLAGESGPAGKFTGVMKVDQGQVSIYAGSSDDNTDLSVGSTPVDGTSGKFLAGSLARTSDGVLYGTRRFSHDVLAITPPATPGAPPMVQRVAGTGGTGLPTAGPALSSPVTEPVSVAVEPATGALILGTVPSSGGGSATTYTPQVLALTVLAPDAPGKPVAVAGYGSASVTVTPAATGLEADSFTVTASPGGASCTIQATDDPLSCEVTGLTAGTSYTYTATANADTTASDASPASEAVIPLATTEVTITGNAVTKVYGQPDPTFGYTVSGLATGDTLTTLPTCGVEGVHVQVDLYDVVCSGAVAPGPEGKYDLVYVLGSLEVTPAPLTVSAEDVSRPVGQVNPPLTYSVDGLVEGDDLEDVLDVEPQLETTATQLSPAGEYPIVFTAASQDVDPRNYEVTFEAGTLSVVPIVTDTDRDGLTDAQEQELGTDPRRADTDRDGLSDGVEVRGIRISARVYTGTGADEAGRVIGLVRTNPLRKDTDRDGLSDRREVRGTNVKQVVQAKGGRYTIGLRVTNPAKADTDGDGLSDKQEVTGSANTKFDRARTDPNRADTDKSGMKDGREIERGFNPVTL